MAALSASWPFAQAKADPVSIADLLDTQTHKVDNNYGQLVGLVVGYDNCSKTTYGDINAELTSDSSEFAGFGISLKGSASAEIHSSLTLRSDFTFKQTQRHSSTNENGFFIFNTANGSAEFSLSSEANV